MPVRQHNDALQGRGAKAPVLLRTLGIPDVAFLGIGALLGGGIFSLLGAAAGLAGGGLVVAMLLGSAIAFINLNAYVALATTFPEAGGGYKWVREGLGDLSGFLSGWFSWFASAVACALYAVSFGFFSETLLFDIADVARGPYAPEEWRLFFAAGITLLFGAVHYRGVKFSGRVGAAVTVTVLVILAAYVLFGAKRIAFDLPLAAFNLTPLLPMGIAGVLQAAGLFYIAFEGSEIQAQTGEEAENPSRTLKVGLFTSWAVVSVVYVLVALVVVGATSGAGVPSWQFLGAADAHAIVASAEQFMPWGHLVMLIGGLLANIGALNATLYSSSRILFAMGRDKLVVPFFGVMHPIFYTPTRALLLSVAAVIAVATLFPVKDIASIADILFIALFIQLNAAYIELRREKPEAKWRYVVPLEPYLPIAAIILYLALAVALFHVSPDAILLFAFWALLGLVNYFGFTKRVERETQAREVVYEHSLRFHPKSRYRVILPLAAKDDFERLGALAAALTKGEGGDLIVLRIHETHEGGDGREAFHAGHDKRDLVRIEDEMAKNRINTETRIVAANSVPRAILEAIAAESANLVLMNWDGNVDTKGSRFGRKVDTVLRRAHCDMLTVKLGEERAFTRVFIPVAIDDNPNLRFTGKVAAALREAFGATITVGMVVPLDVRGRAEEVYEGILRDRLHKLRLDTLSGVVTKLIFSDYIASGILRATSGEYDVVLLPAARGSLSRAIGVGSIPEQVAKQCRRKTVLIAKGYRGLAQPAWDLVGGWFRRIL